MFKGILINSAGDLYGATLTDLDESRLPAGDVTVQVLYSTLNYKDALAITRKAPVVRTFPMVPGIDLVGTVEASESPDYQPGDHVLLNGWGVGETHWGGLAQNARVSSEWLIPLPASLSPRQAMAIGTAGYTAMLCVLALERNGITPDKGEVLVTGAAGGVGSIAVAILSKLGYRVVAATGRLAETEYLIGLGAFEVLGRTEFDRVGKPLGKMRWAGAIDVVGNRVLANVCSTLQYGGVVATCGMAGGLEFPASVAPFILRGVSLIGIDSVMCPRPLRIQAWTRLCEDLDAAKLEAISHVIGLDDVIESARALIEGQVRGRIVVDVQS